MTQDDNNPIPLSRIRAKLARPRGYKRIDALISNTDAHAAVAGLSVPETMQGVDLSRYLRPGFALPDRAIYAESMTPTGYSPLRSGAS